MISQVKTYFETLDLNDISAERQGVLQQLVEYIKEKINSQQPINLTFICTHNSRRSHLGQVWDRKCVLFFRRNRNYRL